MPPSETGPTHFSNCRLLMCMVTAPLSKRVTRNMQANFLFFAAVSGVCDFFIYEEARGQQRRSEIRPRAQASLQWHGTLTAWRTTL